LTFLYWRDTLAADEWQVKEKVRVAMAHQIDFSIATSEQIEAALCEQMEAIRLTRNLTQAQLAHEAGVALKTIRRFEKGEGVSLDTFIRVLMALGLQSNLQNLLPDPTIRPVERVETGGKERKRARPVRSDKEISTWSWGDETAKRK
jgi:transcriptional regulator with XRE-family HTH domain